MKKILTILVIMQLVFLTSGLLLIKDANATEDVNKNVCRISCNSVPGTYVPTGVCKRDAPGPDIEEGSIGACAGPGPSCNKSYCRTDMGEACYVSGTNVTDCSGGGAQ